MIRHLTPGQWGWLRVALAALLLFSVATSVEVAHPAESAKAYTFSTTTRQWTGEVQVSGVPVLWEIKQTASVTITYRVSTGYAVYASVNWLRCAVTTFGIAVSVQWCGATRRDDNSHSPRTSLDFGYNFTKSAWFSTQDCWARRTLDFNVYGINDPRPFKEIQRSGCG